MIPGRDGLVVSMSASHSVGRGFVSQPRHIKEWCKNGANCLLAFHVGVG